MKIPFPRLNITSKLSLLLLIIVLIFYGTIVHVFLHIQNMMKISDEIVSTYNVVENISTVLIENLLEMDANAKRFELLKKEVYLEYYHAAEADFGSALKVMNTLTTDGYTPPPTFIRFRDQYSRHLHEQREPTAEADSIIWVDEDTLNNWLALLVNLRDHNQNQIEQSLMEIHNSTLQSTRNGLFVFGLSVVTAIFGVWIISKSIILPLRQLLHGLQTLSQGDYSNKILVTSKDEFHDLAVAFNDMSEELMEEENLRADFIATLSHEIRTPLSSVKESVDMLAEKVLGDINSKQEKFLTIASGEITRINELLDHLMHVSMLESKHSTGTRKLLSPRTLIENCAKGLSSQASIKGITFHFDFPAEVPKIIVGEKELEQVLVNILGNAIKFSPKKKVINVSIDRTRNPEQIIIAISDQGPGIPNTELSLIFNKYYRSKTVRQHMDGVGLGLYISKKIIQGYGGNIQVKNNKQQGCTFFITIPLPNK